MRSRLQVEYGYEDDYDDGDGGEAMMATTLHGG